MKTRTVLLVGLFLSAVVRADAPDPAPTETTAGWVKHPKNPVLGGDLGTCFDISVLKEGDTYRMWFSWRPKKSIALVESKDGVRWGKPVIVLGPNEKTDWENDLNRPVILKRGDRYHMWYTGQARGHSWIGFATSQDGKTWQRRSDKPVLSADKPWEKVLIPLGQLRRQLAWQLPDNPLPLPLRRLVLGHPEAPGQGDLDLVLVRPPLRLVRRTAHEEPARRTPAEPDAGDLFLAPRSRSECLHLRLDSLSPQPSASYAASFIARFCAVTGMARVPLVRRPPTRLALLARLR
jgi:hypothetical protein